jgi:hypothetical protein
VSTPPPFPHPSGHVISIDPEGAGWKAWCLPHGLLGRYVDHLSAFIKAAEHDRENGGDTT